MPNTPRLDKSKIIELTMMTDLQEVIADNLQPLLDIAEGKRDIEDWNVCAYKMLEETQKKHVAELTKAKLEERANLKAQVRKEIEEHGYRKNEPGWEKISTEVKFYGMGYNDGLSQALSILKEEK